MPKATRVVIGFKIDKNREGPFSVEVLGQFASFSPLAPVSAVLYKISGEIYFDFLVRPKMSGKEEAL